MDLLTDIENIIALLGIDQSKLAELLGLSYERFVSMKKDPERHREFPESLYSLAYEKGIQLNSSYEDLLKDKAREKGETLLFHGAKTRLEGKIDLGHSRNDNDLGKAFYAGERYEQAAMYIANWPSPYVYAFSYKDEGLKIKRYPLSEEWMIVVAYSRGLLAGYSSKKIVQKALKECEGMDLIISPIADNRMYNLISRFCHMELTDKQTLASLAATNLGEQYAFKTEKGLDCLKLLKELYVPQNEKKSLKARRERLHSSSLDKSRLAQRENAGVGRYIDQWE